VARRTAIAHVAVLAVGVGVAAAGDRRVRTRAVRFAGVDGTRDAVVAVAARPRAEPARAGRDVARAGAGAGRAAVRVVAATPGDRIVATAGDGSGGVGARGDVVVACRARRADACPGGAGVVDGAGIAVVAARAVGQKEVVGTRRIRSGARFDCVADTRR